MIIFGTRGRVHRLAMLFLFCRNCNAAYAASLNKSVTKFTLFFVPLFPVHIKHSLTCTWCGTTSKVSKADAEQLRQQSQEPSPQQPHIPHQAPPPG